MDDKSMPTLDQLVELAERMADHEPTERIAEAMGVDRLTAQRWSRMKAVKLATLGVAYSERSPVAAVFHELRYMLYLIPWRLKLARLRMKLRVHVLVSHVMLRRPR
jgi:hypothetical protein